MRGTVVLRRQHIGNMFKVFWMTKGRRRVPDTGAAQILAARGIQVADPKEVISLPYRREYEGIVELPPHIPNKLGIPKDWIAEKTRINSNNLVEHEDPCLLLFNHFRPVMGIPQTQLITNSLIHHTLPSTVLDKAAPTTPEEDERVKQAILNAHLLDGTQKKLPKIQKIGWNAARKYGIPLCRSNKTLTYQLLLLLDQICGGATIDRTLVEDTVTQVKLAHPEGQLLFSHRAAFIISSQTPLPRVATQEEVAATAQEAMPDLHPVSALVSVLPPSRKYVPGDQYGVPLKQQHPHTIVIHNNSSWDKIVEEQFMGASLLFAFSHAAAYAKTMGKTEEDLQKDPVVLQIIHCNRQQYHLGVLQLNTLNLGNSNVRNLFWMEPHWRNLFSLCSFQAAAPTLEGYNPEVFSLLKGLHMQGVTRQAERVKIVEEEKSDKGEGV